MDHDFEFVEQFFVVSFPPNFSLINGLLFHSTNLQGHSSAIRYLLFFYFILTVFMMAAMNVGNCDTTSVYIFIIMWNANSRVTIKARD